MANTQKTTKTNTNVEKPVVKESKPTPKKFAPTEQIPCRSVTVGELIHIGVKTRIQYTWADYGDVAYLEYQDLQALQSMKSRFIIEPLFMIEDDDLINQWGKMLNPIYNKIKEDDLIKFFELPQAKFESALKNAPKGFQNSVKTKTASMIQNGELDSIRKIKTIDEILGTEFVEMFLK